MSVKSLIIVCLAVLMGTSLMAQNKVVGASKCKMCHNSPAKGDQYKKWSDSKHAHAMAALKGDEAKNPKCLKCHLTDAAFPAEGVSCEGCHGAGSAYATMSVMKDKAQAASKGLTLPDEKVCTKCHNKESPNYKPFNYATYVAKIAHKK